MKDVVIVAVLDAGFGRLVPCRLECYSSIVTLRIRLLSREDSSAKVVFVRWVRSAMTGLSQ